MVRGDDREHGAGHQAHDSDIWLAVETGSPTGSVAVWRDGLVFEQTLRIQGNHSERVLPAVEYALQVSETEPAEVSSFVIGAGPGSFTGVRVAAALAKGWAMARGTTIYAYSSLLCVAAGNIADGQVCVLFDARRGEVYAACYEFAEAGFIECLVPGAWRVEELLEELSQRGLKPVFSGGGALLYETTITRSYEGARVLPEHLSVPRASSLLWLRSRYPELGRVERPQEWQPHYVRDWKIPEEHGSK